MSPTSFSGGLGSPSSSRYVTSTVVQYQDGQTLTRVRFYGKFQGGVRWYVSADDGVHWQEITFNTDVAITHTGEKGKWKALLTGEDAEITEFHAEWTVSG